MLTRNHMPSIFTTGLLILVLNKPTLDPGNPLNYTPITMSSTLVWMPKNALIQFGMMASFINYILHDLIYTGDSCIIGIPSLTLC